MRSALIVEVDEAGEARDPSTRLGEGLRIRPLGQEGAHEALSFPVGLGSIRSRPAMPDPELVAGEGEVTAPIAAAVVGQDPLDRDPVRGVEAPGPLEEPGRRDRRLIPELLRVGEPAVIVDREMDRFQPMPRCRLTLMPGIR